MSKIAVETKLHEQRMRIERPYCKKTFEMFHQKSSPTCEKMQIISQTVNYVSMEITYIRD